MLVNLHKVLLLQAFVCGFKHALTLCFFGIYYRFAFQTSVGQPQRTPGTDKQDVDDDSQNIYLGDDQPVLLGDKSSKQALRMSAKQRR
jgi:hypothetical protein